MSAESVNNDAGTEDWYYYITDHAGSVVGVIDESGTLVNHYVYDAFGNVLPHHSYENIPNRYQFHGREYDEHRGDYYYRHRTYIPAWGSFTGPDPVIDPYNPRGAANYLFCRNDPLVYSDPRGLEAWYNPTSDRFPVIGWATGPLSDVAFGTSKAMGGVATLNKSRIGSGFNQIGSGAVRFGKRTVGDFGKFTYGMTVGKYQGYKNAATDSGGFGEFAFSTFLTTVIPSRYPYTGAGFGTEQETRQEIREDLVSYKDELVPNPGAAETKTEWAARIHDWRLDVSRNPDAWKGRKGAAHVDWISHAWTSPMPEPGPTGQAVRLLGTPVFGVASLFK